MAARAELSSAAADLGLTPAQVNAIKSFSSATVATLFPSMTSTQRAWLTTQQSIVRYLVRIALAAKLS